MEENIDVTLDIENTNEIDWEARAKKAEAAIVSMKTKSEKSPVEEVKKDEVNLDEIIETKVKARLAEIEVENNQNLTASMSLSWDENLNWWLTKIISLSEFDKLPQKLKSDYIKTVNTEHWEVKFL